MKGAVYMKTTNGCIGAVFAVLIFSAFFLYGQDNSKKESVSIPMRDGSSLSTDIFMPYGYSKEKYPDGVPAILVVTPYDKSRKSSIAKWQERFVKNGYAFAVQDMRGFYASASAGKGASRHYDGYDTVEWLARQAWCNGKIGMLGYSHLGAAQYETAVTNPPHLACTIPAQAPGNYYTNSLYPSVFRKADMETILRGAFTSRTRQLIEREMRNRSRSELKQFNTPMIHSGGWYDFYREGMIEMFLALRQNGGAGAQKTQKLFIGPWGHGVMQEENPGKPLALPGGMSYPVNAKLDWETEFWLPWFDHWCKGKQTGIMDRPAVRYYLMGDTLNPAALGNIWIESDSFPPKSSPTAYYIYPDKTAGREMPESEEKFMEYRYDPENPVPTVGRTHARLPVRGPYDQRPVEGRSDVLVFTTHELENPLIIAGQVKAKLWASSDKKDTDFTVKLTDVYPDGRSMLFLDGIVKGRYRNTLAKEEFLEPGKIYEFNVDLGYIAIVLAPGHRLRIAISSSNFDRFDINPNTGEPYGDHATTRRLLTERLRPEPVAGNPEYIKTEVATNRIYMDRGRSSHVILPVVSSIEALGHK